MTETLFPALDLQAITSHDITWINCAPQQAAIARALIRTLMHDTCNCTVPPWATPAEVYHCLVDGMADYARLAADGETVESELESLARLSQRINWKRLGEMMQFRVMVIESCFVRDRYDYQSLLETLHLLAQTTGRDVSLYPQGGANFLILNTAPKGKEAPHNEHFCHRHSFPDNIDWPQLEAIAAFLAQAMLKNPFNPQDIWGLLKEGKLSVEVLEGIMNIKYKPDQL